MTVTIPTGTFDVTITSTVPQSTSTSWSANTACRIPLAISCFSFTTSMEVSANIVARCRSPFPPCSWVILVVSSSQISATIFIRLTLALLSDTPFPTIDQVTRSGSWQAMSLACTHSQQCANSLPCCNPLQTPRPLSDYHNLISSTKPKSSQSVCVKLYQESQCCPQSTVCTINKGSSGNHHQKPKSLSPSTASLMCKNHTQKSRSPKTASLVCQNPLTCITPLCWTHQAHGFHRAPSLESTPSHQPSAMHHIACLH